VFVSGTTAGRRSWLVPGGTTAVAVVDDARKAPLLRNLGLADGETVLFDGPLPTRSRARGP